MPGLEIRQGGRRASVRHRFRPSVEAMESKELLSVAHAHVAAHRPVARPAPAVVTSAVAVTAPSTNLPLGVNFDLASRWVSTQTSSPFDLLTVSNVSMSSDSTIWAASNTQSNGQTQGTLYQYDPHGGVWYQVFTVPTQIDEISAEQAKDFGTGKGIERRIWVLYGTSATGTTAALVDQYGGYGGSVTVLRTTSLPGNVSITSIAAGSDGTAWATGQGGGVYSYNGAALNTWTRRPRGGNQIFSLSVGSASNVWAGALTGNPNGTLKLLQLVNGTWKAAPVLPGLTANFAATADGTVWAAPTGGGLYVLPPGGTAWVAVQPGASLSGAQGLAAGSRYRAVALTTSDLSLLTYGLADQPTTGYPVWTGGKARAYAYMNQQLGITAPGGVRFQYTNQFAVNNLPTYQSLILTMAAPSGVRASDWRTVQSRILTEISAVLGTYQVYNEIEALDNWIAFESTSLLSQVNGLVSLTNQQQTSSVFGVIFEQLFAAALAGIAKAITGGAGVAASVIASGINSAIGDLTKGGSSPTTQSTYVELQSQLSTIITQAHESDSDDKGAILSDPNRYLPIGAGISNGTLNWPVGSNQTLAQNADDAFETYFLQVLAPIRFTIYKINYVYEAAQYDYPAYDRYYVPDGDTGVGTLYTLATFGNRNDYAVAGLISAITNLTGVSLAGLLTNQLGWFQVQSID